MKKREAYKVFKDADREFYRFNSQGPKGNITKAIEFSDLGNNVWNLGFGDFTEKDWSDNVISDNDDMRKVLQTVANVVHSFTEKNPERKIYIEPVDRKRSVLYNRLFQQKWEEIREYFEVNAGEKGQPFLEAEPYNPKVLSLFYLEAQMTYF